jgi:hypothetical protein
MAKAQYVGMPVTIHYDPGDPTLAVLEPGVSEGAYIQLLISSAFVILGLLVAWCFGALPFVPPSRRRTASKE